MTHFLVRAKTFISIELLTAPITCIHIVSLMLPFHVYLETCFICELHATPVAIISYRMSLFLMCIEGCPVTEFHVALVTIIRYRMP